MKSKSNLFLILGFGAIAFTNSAAHSENSQPLNSMQIEEALLGNSVLHPSFGCVFYRDKTTAVLHTNSGVISEYSWRISDDKYISTGSCDAIGCAIRGGVDSIEFMRVDQGYFRKTHLIKGNACEAGQLST